MIVASSPASLSRTDALSGCCNLLAFADWLVAYCAATPRLSVSLVSLDLNAFVTPDGERNDEDSILRWLAIVLSETSAVPIYRTGGDQFVFALIEGDFAAHTARCERLCDRLNSEADRFGLRAPLATVALVRYTGDEAITPADVLGQLRAATARIRKTQRSPLGAFPVTDLAPPYDLQRIVNDILLRMVALGQMLDESRQLANTDPVTGLPNLRAALEALAAALAQAASGSSFALLFIDGDNLRRYNDLGYAAGDAMLQRLCRTLRGRLRPDDLLARWRVGDEFLVLLSNTALERAMGLAERLRGAVEEESRAWLYPVTISIGVAVYPRHGETVDRLLHAGECAKERAKAEGKNRVVVAAERAGGD